MSLALGLFIITLPLTIASIGRRLWIRYRFTNKRMVVMTNSPLLKREVQVRARGLCRQRGGGRRKGARGWPLASERPLACHASTRLPACLPLPLPPAPQVSYDQIREIRSAARAFGLWGDVVIFLKDGSRLELAGLEDFQAIVDHIEACRGGAR